MTVLKWLKKKAEDALRVLGHRVGVVDTEYDRMRSEVLAGAPHAVSCGPRPRLRCDGP